jgi:dTMP kinase
VKSSHSFAGYLIAIEGIDGAGKSTHAQQLEEKLLARQLPVVRTREPTTGPWGQVLRESALTGRLSVEEELEAFIKDRREHVAQLIIPELRAGKIVIIDRYYFSNMAYQGARGINPEDIRRRNEAFAPEPDLLVLLDIDPKAGLERIRARGDRANLFEETRALAKAREIFKSIDKPYLYSIDARLPAETICQSILRRFGAVIGERLARTEEGSAVGVSESLRLFAASPEA